MLAAHLLRSDEYLCILGLLLGLRGDAVLSRHLEPGHETQGETTRQGQTQAFEVECLP